MKLSIRKDPIFILLLIVVLIIWGIITSKIISHFDNDEEPAIEIVDDVLPSSLVSNPSNIIDNEIEYVKLERDPFVLNPVKRKVKKTVKKVEPVIPKEYLNFIVNGVIVNDKSKTVLIIDQTNNQTVFLKEGMEYKTIKVVSISATEIKISEHNQNRTVSVNK